MLPYSIQNFQTTAQMEWMLRSFHDICLYRSFPRMSYIALTKVLLNIHVSDSPCQRATNMSSWQHTIVVLLKTLEYSVMNAMSIIGTFFLFQTTLNQDIIYSDGALSHEQVWHIIWYYNMIVVFLRAFDRFIFACDRLIPASIPFIGTPPPPHYNQTTHSHHFIWNNLLIK